MRWHGRFKLDTTLHDWRPWFAWHPVKTIDARWVWLEHVQYTSWQSKNLTVEQHRQNCPSNWHYRITDGE